MNTIRNSLVQRGIVVVTAVGLAIGGPLIAAPVAGATFSQSAYDSCMAKPPKRDPEFGFTESAFAQKKRCCAAAGGVISAYGSLGLPQCKAPEPTRRG